MRATTATDAAAFFFPLQPVAKVQEQGKNVTFKVSSETNVVFVLAGNTNENMRCFSLNWQVHKKSKSALSLLTMQKLQTAGSYDAVCVSLDRALAQITIQTCHPQLSQPTQRGSSLYFKTFVFKNSLHPQLFHKFLQLQAQVYTTNAVFIPTRMHSFTNYTGVNY